MRLPGFVATAYGMFGHHAIDPATGAPASDRKEYNVTLD